MVNNYQLTLLVKSNLTEGAKIDLLSSVTKKFAKLFKENLWGNKDLAYPIKKATKAYFAHFEFEAEAKEISPLDKSLKLNEDILRYLLIRKG